MSDLFDFFVVADKRYTRDSFVYGIFFTEGQAVLFRDAFHSTSKIFKCDKSFLKIDCYGVKVYTGNLVSVK